MVDYFNHTLCIDTGVEMAGVTDVDHHEVIVLSDMMCIKCNGPVAQGLADALIERGTADRLGLKALQVKQLGESNTPRVSIDIEVGRAADISLS